eukprot:512550-Hanusia_phi.AAC.3
MQVLPTVIRGRAPLSSNQLERHPADQAASPSCPPPSQLASLRDGKKGGRAGARLPACFRSTLGKLFPLLLILQLRNCKLTQKSHPQPCCSQPSFLLGPARR